MFPLIAMYAHLERAALRNKILQKRKLLLLPMALLVTILCGFGDLIIHMLYDNRYAQAGWILPLLAIGMWPLLLYSTMDRSLYVVDNPKHPAIGNISKFVYMVVCLPLAYHFTGKLGAVLVIAFNDIPVWLAINYGLYKKGLSCLRQDAWATILLLVLLGLVSYSRYLLGWGIPGYKAFQGIALF
jgi:O-antigen/teichoic acid export membrane protein